MAFTGNVVCNSFKLAQWNGGVNFATATFKLALYTSAASLGVTTAAYTSAGEVSAGGYTAGGVPLTVTVQPTVDGTTTIVGFQNVTINAALTARGALIYMADASSTAVCVLDFGADKTSLSTFAIQFPVTAAATAILRLK